jgi:SAM-dependent methyltransferase
MFRAISWIVVVQGKDDPRNYTKLHEDQHKRHFLPAAGHDVFLPFYDPIMRLIGCDRARRDLIELANIQPGQRILDIGCGTGTFVVELKRLNPSTEVIGLDPDPKALLRANAKASRAGVSVQLDQGFADALPYERGSFDRVFSLLMFHHLNEGDREKSLWEVARVLKPGGSFHLLDFAGEGRGSPALLERMAHSRDQMKDNSDARILEMLLSTGFKNVKLVKARSLLLGLLRSAYYQGNM